MNRRISALVSAVSSWPQRRGRLMHAYILRQIAGPMLIIWAALIFQIWVIQMGNLWRQILPYAPAASTYWGLSSLLLPPLVNLVLPIAFICGVLYGFNKMRREQELVVFFSAGARPSQVLAAPLALALLLGACNAALSLAIVPFSQQYLAQRVAALGTSLPFNSLPQPGAFFEPVPGLTVYAQQIAPPDMIRFMMTDTRQPGTTISWFAQRAQLIQQGNDKQILLYQGSVHTRREGENLSIVQFEEYVHDFSRYAEPLRLPPLRSLARYLPDLFAPDPEDAYAQPRRLSLAAAGHNNLARPLHPLALGLLMLVLLLNGPLAHALWRRRLALAAAASVAWVLVSFALYSLAANTLWGWVTIYLFPLVTIGAAAILLMRMAAPADGAARLT